MIIALVFLTIQVTAQERQREHRKGGDKERMHQMQDFTPEEMSELRTKKMVLNLNLDESQQREFQKLNLEQARSHKERMASRENRMKGEKPERPSKEDVLKMKNNKLDNQIATKKKMKSILNKEQFEKWEKGHARGDRMKGPKKEMKRKRS